jgi:hypothetical protein
MTYIPSSFRCTVCGIERAPSNRGWFELHVDGGDKGDRAANVPPTPPSLLVQSFDENHAEGIEHYCGEQCLQLGIGRKLTQLHPELQAPNPSELHKASSVVAGEAAEPPVELPVEFLNPRCTCRRYPDGRLTRFNSGCPIHGPQPVEQEDDENGPF